jgi:hypothetical protein
VRRLLTTAVGSKRRVQTSPLLGALLEQVRDWPRGTWLLDSQGLAAGLGELTVAHRNPAAHIQVLHAADYTACRQLVADEDGLLWRLVDATGL